MGLIEPYITEKQCLMCLKCKPLTCFSPTRRGIHGVQSYCKPCRSAMVNAKARGDRKKRGNQGDTSPTAWLVPSMSMVQSLRCIQFRKWRGPVSGEPLRARI